MNRKKIFNDPVYGFVTIPHGILFDLVEHPYFQRLRRIGQVGFTHYVYPGALHTRFHHAIGALHLMTEAIDVLRSKSVVITEEEAEAVSIAILLHDIGHGPFSHALEHALVNVHHEELSIFFMEELNHQFDNKLSLAIQIFKNEHPKRFLYQLVSGQLDMDRMDYLNRDSFFTGVSEGVIGYDRIIKMLDVKNGELVVEEKGIYSIEKFLIARRLMYWQVYLHKTSIVAEHLLIKSLKRAKELALSGNVDLEVSKPLRFFLYKKLDQSDFDKNRQELLENFALLDDVDVVMALKNFMNHEDSILSFLAKSLIERRLFKVELKNEDFSSDYLEKVRQKVASVNGLDVHSPKIDYLVFNGKETNSAYSKSINEIKILFKDGKIVPMSAISDHGVPSQIITKYYLCYPKKIF